MTIRTFPVGVVLSALVACSDSSEPTEPIVAGISVAIAPANVSVARGGNTTVVVTVSRVAGFSNAIISPSQFEGLPTGVTPNQESVTVSPPPGGVSETFRVEVSAAAPVGTHTITIRAFGHGVPDTTATLKLTIS
jgi:hypothetical protein